MSGHGHDRARRRRRAQAKEELRVLTVGDRAQCLRGRALERRIELDLGQRRRRDRDHDRVHLDLVRSVATFTAPCDQRTFRAGEERCTAAPSSAASASASRMLPPSSVWLSKSPKVDAPSSSTEAARSSAGWPFEIATRVRISAERGGSKPKAGDHIGSACGVRGRAPGDAVECVLEGGLGHSLLADRHAPPVGRPLEHQRDPEARGQGLHLLVTGQDELGAPLDHRSLSERHRPDAAPHPVARLEHGHLGSAGAQGVGRGEARKAGADDADPLHSSPPAHASRSGSSQVRAPSGRLGAAVPVTDANEQRTIETEVVVIGGGIAGLTAASELAAAGTDVAVLEARDRVGGRTWNTEIGGEANELGGQWVAPYQSAMHELLADLEIELFPSFRTGEHVYVDPNGKSHRYEGHDAPMGQASEKAFEAADAKLDSLAKVLDPEAPWEHPDAERLDGITLEAWLRDEVSDEMARDMLRSWLAGGFLAKPAHTFSLLQALWMIAGAGGTYELFEPDQCLAYRVVGGSQLISMRLAERLGERVALNAPVREIRWGEDSVEVEAEGVVAEGRRAIVAVPPNLTNSIRFQPSLPAWRMRMAQAMSQGSINKVLAVYETPFWRDDGLSGQGFAPYELVRELYDNSPPSAPQAYSAPSSPARTPSGQDGWATRSGAARCCKGWPSTSARERSSRSTTSRPTGPRRSGRGAPTEPASARAG